MEDCQNDAASKYGYIYTALNPSLVSHCTTGSFLGPGQTNLVIAKNAYLEVYSLEKNQLQLQCQIPTYIRVRKLMTIKTMFPIDLVFLVLDVYFVVAGFDFETKELHPLYSEKILTRDQTDRPDLIFTAHIPTEPLPKRFIASYSVDGVFMHFDFDLDLKFSEGHGLSGTLTMKASDFIMDVSCDIVDSIFLNDGYTVGLLIRDTETKVISVRTYDIEPTQSSLIPGSILGTTSDTTTSLFASSPINGGIITIGIQEVNYFKLSGNIKSSFSTADLTKEEMNRFRIVKECLSLESNLFLCGDVFARWFLIQAEKDQFGEVKNLIRMELGDFGEFECCSKLSKVQRDHYLLAYDVFVGMTKTDAQLVTVVPTNPVGNRLNSYAKYNSFYATNAVINGPDSEKRTVVGCSERNNSLSILKNGVNVTEYAWFEQHNVKATWAVKKHLDDEYHSFLVFSFVGQTRVLRAGKEVTEVTIKTIRPDVETLYIGNAGHGFIVHVTTQGIALLNSGFKIVHEWNVLNGVLSAAVACLSQVTVSQGRILYTFSIEHNGLVLQSSTVLSDDIAFVIYDLRNNIGQAVFVALWRSNEVLCLSLPSLQQQSMIQLPAEVVIRCLALHNTNLVIGLGDGRVLHYVYDPMTHALTKGTTFRVGTTQARCATIDMPEINRSFFFVCTDKPSLIVDDVFGLRVVPVNVQVPIWYVCPFKFEYIKGWALVACNDNEVKVISVENVDKLPTKFDLKEFIPCDIDHSSLNSFYSVICSRNGGAYILLIDIDQSVYHPQNQYQFLIDNDAEPLCICNLKMTSPSTGQPTDYLGAVTRTLEISTLSLYQVKRNGDGIFNVVEFQSAQFENRVLSMKCYKGMAILCCPESLILVNFNADGDLDFVADYDGLIYHHVATDPQSGLIVPLGLSTELEFFKIDEDNKTVIIRQLDMDDSAGYKCIDIPLKVAFLNGEYKQVVAGTMQGRLQFFFGPSSNKKDRKVDFYLSDAISSMNTMGESSVMYTTQSGAVGVCKLISKEDSEVLSEIQRRLSERLKMLVPISHDEIRFNYSAIEDEEYVPQGSLKTNLVDGDFVMKYLTLRNEQKEQIEKEMNMNVTDYIQKFHQGLRFC